MLISIKCDEENKGYENVFRTIFVNKIFICHVPELVIIYIFIPLGHLHKIHINSYWTVAAIYVLCKSSTKTKYKDYLCFSKCILCFVLRHCYTEKNHTIGLEYIYIYKFIAIYTRTQATHRSPRNVLPAIKRMLYEQRKIVIKNTWKLENTF